MRRVLPVTPQLQSLNRPNAADIAKCVGPALCIGPDHVNVKTVYQILSPEVALEVYSRFDCGEFVFDIHGLVQDYHAVLGRISHAVHFAKSDVLLKQARVGELPVSRVEGMREGVGGVWGGY